MHARTQLAVLDHNCGIGREQARTKDGKLRYKVNYSKVTASWVPKKISTAKDKTYLSEIITRMWNLPSTFEQTQMEEVPKNIAPVENPGKDNVIKSKTTRFQ